MRKLYTILAVLALMGQHCTSQAFVDLTLESKSVNAGSSVAINAIWSSTTPLDYLTTEFIVTAVGFSPSGEVFFSTTAGAPPVPPLTDTNYVFSSNSDDLINLTSTNPASVYTTNWSNDTYNFADSTSVAGDYVQNGTRIWTILNLDISSLASGSYQIILGSSGYTNAASPSLPGLTPSFTGGLITINAVPEPSTWALAAIGATALAALSRRHQRA